MARPRGDRDHHRHRPLRAAARAGASLDGLGATRRARWALPLLLAGSAVVAGVTAADTDTRWQRGFDRWADVRSPIAHTASDLAAGSAIYRARCQPCHSERGRGDGPAGAALRPRPADLVLHVPQHTDGELYYFVSLGVPGTAMPAWRSALSERERWQVVLYLRELAGP